MLITWMGEEDRKRFHLEDYRPFEVVVAYHRRLKKILGYLAFSRNEKIIKEVEVFEKEKEKIIKEKLTLVASRQLTPVSGSFHSLYPNFHERMKEEHCPVCKNDPMTGGMEDIAVLKYSYVSSRPTAQGKLYGKLVVISKKHNVHFYDLSKEDMANFMSDVQKTAKALHQISGAVKINYEIHGNSGAHLHCHLFPRYLDDDFPGISIDYHKTEPSPYLQDEDYQYFFTEMRRLLTNQRT